MNSFAVRTAWYRTAVSWRRQRSSYLVLVVLIGLAGGVALGSLAAARRTASSFPTFLAASNPSDLAIDPAGAGPNGPASAHLPAIIRAVRSYPQVKRVESYVALQASLVKDGRIERRTLNSNVVLVGSVDGLLFNQDRFAVTSGRMADPARADEVMVTENAAAAMGLHLGSRVPVAIPTAPTAAGSNAVRRITLKVVGIGLLNREVVQDQIAKFPTYIVATPALTKSVAVGQLVYLGVQLRDGPAGVAAVERRWNSSQLYFTDFTVTSQIDAEAQQAIRPESLALGVFGGIAALATLFLAMQVIARALGAREHDLVVMRAVGADPATTELDGVIGIVASVMIGSVLAVGVALALSPLFPIGPVRPVYPDPGVNADWTVLGVGFAVLFGALVAVTAIISFRDAPHRALRRSHLTGRRSSTVQLATAFGVSALSRCRSVLRRRHEERQGHRSLPLVAPLCGHRNDRGDDDPDLRSQLAHAGVPACSVRVELGLRRAELGRLRARSGQSGGGPAPRPCRPVVLGGLVRDVATRRRGSADVARSPRFAGRAAHRVWSWAGHIA